MTQSLRFDGTDLKVGESDVISNITMTYGQLTSGDSYTEARIATGSTTVYGTYYNYCAISAGEVCDGTTQQNTTRSVCPAGWKLPIQTQLNAVSTGDSHFTAAAGCAGYYSGGSLGFAKSDGYWWSANVYDATRRHNLYYSSSSGQFLDDGNFARHVGFFVRCVKSS